MRTIKFCLLLPLIFLTHLSAAQKAVIASAKAAPARPKLIVGIVVDQMRYDYLFKYGNKFSEKGFKRLMKEGFLCRNANYSYVPTYTAPGHACIYTGTTPAVNGIVSNEWYDRYSKSEVYCVSDSTVFPVGTDNESGKMSPHRMMSTTITDELRTASHFRSKVIGISLKDRGSILPAGHTPTAAYWHDPSSDNWVSSSYYMVELPSWLKAYNARKRADTFLSKPWTPLLPISAYTESSADSTAYESLFPGETMPVFPHDLPAIRPKMADLIRKTPFGNTFTREAAMEAIKGENLGKGNETDFIAISFSSTDYVGHMYGTQAIELEDTYLRLDADLAELLTFLDSWTGKNNTLVFLTADHGAADNVLFSEDHDLPGGNLNFTPWSDSLGKYLESRYGPGKYIVNSYSTGVYLDHALLTEKKIERNDIQNACAAYLSGIPQVAAVLTAEELKKESICNGPGSFMERGYYDQRSPDITMVLQPGWMEWFRTTGTTHGSPYSYDTHVPLLFYGWKISPGSTADPVDICDIAPTLSTLLNIPFPSGTIGKPIRAVMNDNR